MSVRTQAEIRARFDDVRTGGDDLFGFRQEALLEAMEYDTVVDTDALKQDPGRDEWPTPDVATRAREYLVFAVGKAVDHRGISASRSIEKLDEWLWCLGEDELAARLHAADYSMYGAPKLQILAEAWQIDHEHATDPGWLRMVQGLPCRRICDAGCDR
jgi:hypothetical protein